MGLLAGKRFLIVGVASKLSIASGIAEAMHREGAELAFTYQNEKLKDRVTKFAAGWGSNDSLCFPCDVASDEEIENVFAELGKQWDGLDGIIHAVGLLRLGSLMAATSMSPPVKDSALLMTSAPSALLPWPRRVRRC